MFGRLEEGTEKPRIFLEDALWQFSLTERSSEEPLTDVPRHTTSANDE